MRDFLDEPPALRRSALEACDRRRKAGFIDEHEPLRMSLPGPLRLTRFGAPDHAMTGMPRQAWPPHDLFGALPRRHARAWWYEPSKHETVAAMHSPRPAANLRGTGYVAEIGIKNWRIP
jgi:hypothetical protein